MIRRKFISWLTLLLQIRIRARDLSRPEKTAEANVRVTIQRDLKKPKFNNKRYTATVPENIEVGKNVDIKPGAVRGTDEDKKVCTNVILRMTN